MLLTSLELTPADFEAATGWAAEPEGMCKGDVCVPAPEAVGGRLDVEAVAARLGMALVADPDSGESLSREFKIPARGADGPVFANGKRQQPPSIEAAIVSNSGQNGKGDVLVTAEPKVELKATFTGSQSPFNVWVTDSPLSLHRQLDPDKVFFASSRGTEKLEFTTSVPLSVGTNHIHVVASDENGLVSRKVLVVRRLPPEVSTKCVSK